MDLEYEIINGSKFPVITWYMVKFKNMDYEVGVVCDYKGFCKFLDENKDIIDSDFHKNSNNKINKI